MALVKSISIPLGTTMPAFDLKDPAGKPYRSEDLFEHEDRSGVIVAFMCNHCPYAIAVWPRLIRLAKYAKKMRIKTVAINPNIHPDYPQDNPDEMKKKIEEWEIDFPYLVDESQQVARSFDAQCTPDIYVFDYHQKLIYHGRFDDNWQDESKVAHQELKDAIDAYVDGKAVSEDQKPAIGCSIKWR